MQPFSSEPSASITGEISVPGDKSISHRALIIAGLAVGRSVIRGLLEGDDVLRTATVMRALGVHLTRGDETTWAVNGTGVGGLCEPDNILDMGNSGTGARLILGALSSHPITAFVTGDASLRQRPMNRIIEPLTRIGAIFVGRNHGRLPVAVCGTGEPLPITHSPSIASAQVKSAILLAGLNTPGLTRVVEAEPTRDHTEIMLQHFGAKITVSESTNDRTITLVGQPELQGTDVDIPGDFSSAAFPLVATLITEGSELTLRHVGINPQRTGLLTTLLEMGADITLDNQRTQAGELVADIIIRSSQLHGVKVPAIRAPSMIDEYPVLAVAAAYATGSTIMPGLKELRFKESDRLFSTVQGLTSCSVATETNGDVLTVHGTGDTKPMGGHIQTQLDHRIAMSFLVLGISAASPVTVDDGSTIASSFPGFLTLMNSIGANITKEEVS